MRLIKNDFNVDFNNEVYEGATGVSVNLINNSTLSGVADEVMSDEGFATMETNDDQWYDFFVHIEKGENGLDAALGFDVSNNKATAGPIYIPNTYYNKGVLLSAVESELAQAGDDLMHYFRLIDADLDRIKEYFHEGIANMVDESFLAKENALGIRSGDVSPEIQLKLDDAIDNLATEMTYAISYMYNTQPKLKNYTVLYRDFAESEVNIMATSEEEALEIAREKHLDFFKSDMSFVDDVMYVTGIDGVAQDVPERR